MVTQSFSQVHEIDYNKTFASIIKQELLRIFLAIAVILKMILWQIDVISTYLKRPVGQDKHHPIYMRIPQGYKTG